MGHVWIAPKSSKCLKYECVRHVVRVIQRKRSLELAASAIASSSDLKSLFVSVVLASRKGESRRKLQPCLKSV